MKSIKCAGGCGRRKDTAVTITKGPPSGGFTTLPRWTCPECTALSAKRAGVAKPALEETPVSEKKKDVAFTLLPPRKIAKTPAVPAAPEADEPATDASGTSTTGSPAGLPDVAPPAAASGA